MGVDKTATNGAEKRKLYRVINEDGDYVQQLPETSAEQVSVKDSDNKFTATDVEGVLKELDSKIGSLDTGVTGVKGNKETTYRKGNVNLTPANIGAATDTDVNTIKGKIPAAASSTNQLADKDYVGTTIDNKLTKYPTKTDLQNGLAGKAETKTYDSYSAFVTAVNALSNSALKVGYNILIKTLEVPDMWVSAVNATKTTYTYTNDDAIVTALKTGELKVGYYSFSPLEANKVDFDYTELKNKPKINTNNTLNQPVLSNAELSGTIQLHKIASTGKFDDLVDSPVHQTDTMGEDGLNNSDYTKCGLYHVPVNIDYSPFSLGSKNNVTGMNVPDKMWLSVTIAQETEDASQGLNTITQRLVYGDKIAIRSQKYETSVSTLIWSNWTIYDLSTFAKKTDIPTIPNIEVATAGSGVVSDVAVDSTNKHKLKVTKKALTNSDLPNSGVTAGTYTAVVVNAKGVVTKGGTAIEFGTASKNTPSANLMIGGLFFELQT